MVGRFVQKDPIGFRGGDVNLYAYVGNNPVNRIDPMGLIWVTVGYDYLGVSNWLTGGLNYVTDLIGSGMDPIVPGSNPSHYTGMQRDVIQEWRHDPNNPCRDGVHQTGSKRYIRQTYIKYMNPGPASALVNEPDDPYFYQWTPWVSSPTYQDYNTLYWTQGE